MLNVIVELLGVPLSTWYGKLHILLDEEDSMGYIRGCVVLYVFLCMVVYRSEWMEDDQE